MTQDQIPRFLEAAVPPVPAHLLRPPYEGIRRRARRSRTLQVGGAAALAVVAATVGVVAVVGPARGPSTVVGVPPTHSSTPTGERLDMRSAIPLGFMYENHDGPGGAGVGSAPPCLGQPVAQYGIARFVDGRVDRPIVRHSLYVYPNVATATQVFTEAVKDARALLACNGWTGAPISVERPPYGAEAFMVTFPLPLDGAGEHAGEPAPILLFRVGASIIQLEAHPGAGPPDTERRGQAEMETDARVMEARMCLYDPECGPRAGLPAQLIDLHDGEAAWAAVLGVFQDDDPDARPGAWVAKAAELGYRAGIVPVTCDVGAGLALGIADQDANYAAVYFTSRADAEAFAAAIPDIYVRTLEVTTYCVAR